MPDSTIQQIKDRLDIVEVVSSYIKLEKTGINLRAACPFHGEKTPSFFVSPTRQMFKCFGCGESGSVFDFVMKMEGIEFGDALRLLARKAGVQLPDYHPEIQTKKNRLYEICETSCLFFEKQLHSSNNGQQVLKYLAGRGLTEESIKKWRLGYAPDQWRSLSDFLVGKGYRREEILEAGLAVASEKGGDSYDRFRGRIIFPVFDLNSQVVGFGARVFEKPGEKAEKGAKYINSPATPLYDKSRVLYGLNFAKTEIRRNDQCILTEGYMDVILSHQAGFANTVAASGTALTNLHLKTIKRYTNNLLMAFDADAGGDAATTRGIDLAIGEELNVKVILMPKGLDPADVISQNPEQWAKLIESAQEIMSFYFETALNRFDAALPSGKKQIAQFILPYLKKISNAIVRSHWAQKLADILQVSEGAVLEEMARIETGNDNSIGSYAPACPPSVVKTEAKSRGALLQERLVSLVLNYPSGLDFIDQASLELFSSNGAKEIVKTLKSRPVESPESAQAICQELSGRDKEVEGFLGDVLFWSEVQPSEDGFAEIQLCL
ncbi:MAG: DNA primase, partial [Candidatus Pacebacteria bacterium]|nr:DNA primase [Candidatus Paceibacterota bacterium]